MSTLHELVNIGNDFERLRVLLESRENANEIDLYGNTPLHIVASKERTSLQDIEGSVQMAGVLIDFGAQINKRNRRGYAPLLLAVIAENNRMVEFLLNKEADIHVTDNRRNTALHLAIKRPENIANFPVLDEYYASRKPILEMVKTVLRFEPDVNARNSLKLTPLLLAVEYQDFPVVQNLLKQNATVCHYDIKQKCPMYYALDRAAINLDIVIEVFRHGGKFYGSSPFFIPMNRYFHFLRDAPLTEMEKAKCVFKLFFLGNESLYPIHEREIEEISTLNNFPLSRYIRDLRNEIDQMKEDKLAFDFFVYNMAQRGFFCLTEESKDQFSHFFDTVLRKLTISEYPLYRDMIVSGITRSYLENKFAEACVILRRTGREFLDNDTSHMLHPYLSRLDIANCIIAFLV